MLIDSDPCHEGILRLAYVESETGGRLQDMRTRESYEVWWHDLDLTVVWGGVEYRQAWCLPAIECAGAFFRHAMPAPAREFWKRHGGTASMFHQVVGQLWQYDAYNHTMKLVPVRIELSERQTIYSAAHFQHVAPTPLDLPDDSFRFVTAAYKRLRLAGLDDGEAFDITLELAARAALVLEAIAETPYLRQSVREGLERHLEMQANARKEVM